MRPLKFLGKSACIQSSSVCPWISVNDKATRTRSASFGHMRNASRAITGIWAVRQMFTYHTFSFAYVNPFILCPLSFVSRRNIVSCWCDSIRGSHYPTIAYAAGGIWIISKVCFCEFVPEFVSKLYFWICIFFVWCEVGLVSLYLLNKPSFCCLCDIRHKALSRVSSWPGFCSANSARKIYFFTARLFVTILSPILCYSNIQPVNI